MKKALAMFHDKEFTGILIRVSIPIILQNLISSSLNLIDTMMIGAVGQTEIAAVGIANQIFFLLNLAFFGITSGASMFTAQFWGKKDIASIRKVLGLSLISSMIAASAFTILALGFPEFAMRIFSPDPEVIRVGSDYLRIVGISYLFTAGSYVYVSVLRSTENARPPLLVSAVSLSVNAVFNYLLIFGKGGFPVLGVKGAAIATLMARVLEVTLLLIIVYKKPCAASAKLHELVGFHKEFIIGFYKKALPVIFNESLWAWGMSAYMMVYARIGTGAAAAANITNTFDNMAMVFFYGLGNACAVSIGKLIGNSDEKRARLYAKRYIGISLVVGALVGLSMIGLSRPVLSIYNVDEATRYAAVFMITAVGIAKPVRAFNHMAVVGILRSGGDVRFTLIADSGCLWVVGVSMVSLTGLVIGLPIYYVYLFVIVEDLVKCALLSFRVKSGRWVKNIISAMGAA